MKPTATIDVIIPVLGDSGPLARLLAQISQWGDAALQVIVVAGDDDPATAEVAQRAGARYLCTEPCRGRQLDVGAQAATGDILWFLHADAVPQPGAGAAIRAAVAQGAVGGYFCFGFQGRPTATKRLLAAAINLRARIGVPYGDQALFATRAAYGRAGGYPHQPLFEEVALVRGLRRSGRFRQLRLGVGVDPRRWENDGFLTRTLRNRWLALRYALGTPSQHLAASYPSRIRSPGHG
jgi:rSAM/selenodomain-associated transferase 2